VIEGNFFRRSASAAPNWNEAVGWRAPDNEEGKIDKSKALPQKILEHL
jgi:hypothetical protein